VRPFLVRTGIAVVALAALGPAGPRAAAGMLYHDRFPPPPGMAGDDFARPLVDERLPVYPEEVAPPPPLEPAPPHPLAVPAVSWSQTSQAGSANVAGGTGPLPVPVAGLPSGTERPAPPLVTFLLDRRCDPVPDPVLSAIFHPPRCNLRG
jgi:hypothetical protein